MTWMGGGMVRWLSFRLRNGQSIGPDELRQAWRWACQNPRGGVRRESIGDGVWVYGLYGPEFISNHQEAEQRMRGFLTNSGYTFTIGPLGRCNRRHSSE